MTGLRRSPTLHVGCIEGRAKTMPTDETRSALPVKWAFVVHLRPGALPEEWRVAGRVGHLASRPGEQFGALPGLLPLPRPGLRATPPAAPTPGRARWAGRLPSRGGAGRAEA